MKITICTATYNRSSLLERVWSSLVEQEFDEMEWIVVDDGSIDDTKNVVERLSARKETFFDVRCLYQKNGGKHRAINRAVKVARGELFFVVDSDDRLENGALKKIWEVWDNVCNKDAFAGVCGYMRHENGSRIGNCCKKFDVLDCSQIEFWNLFRGKGDMAEVFRSDVLRDMPFPEIDGEMFCPEELEWVRISRKYKMRYFNETIYVRDYLQNGLTDRIVKIRMNSPIATCMDYKEYNDAKGLLLRKKIRNAINFWRFWFCAKDKTRIEMVNCIEWVWCPFGLCMHIIDLIMVK